MDKEGTIGFQSYGELLSLHPATATATATAVPITTTSTTSSTSTTTSSAGATTTSTASAVTSTDAAAVLPISPSPTNAAAKPNPNTDATSTTTSGIDSAEAVQQLLRQISAAELCNAVSLLRDPASGEFDLSLLQRHWPVAGDTARIYITVE